MLIFVSGSTCSGKTTLAQKLQNEFSLNGNCTLISQDGFWLPPKDRPSINKRKYGDEWNWETLASVNLDGDSSGRSKKSKIGFIGVCEDAILNKKENEVVIIEGFLLHCIEKIWIKYQDVAKRVFVATKQQICWDRRLERSKRRKSSLLYWKDFVWKYFIEQSKDVLKESNLFIMNGEDLNNDYDALLDYVRDDKLETGLIGNIEAFHHCHQSEIQETEEPPKKRRKI